ncbi:MAG: YhbY family RNA-binding protein, partial [Pseudomonadales bacterium]
GVIARHYLQSATEVRLLVLTSAQQRALRARAHALNPVVAIGDKGVTSTVIRELETSLDAHELIKVRTGEADRDARDKLLMHICGKLNAAPVQHIGKILVIYRPSAEETSSSPKRRAPAKAKRTKRSHQ